MNGCPGWLSLGLLEEVFKRIEMRVVLIFGKRFRTALRDYVHDINLIHMCEEHNTYVYYSFT